MALEVRRHMNPDGTYSVENYWTPLAGEEGLDAPIAVIQTGPCGGSIVLSNGQAYDVTPEHIQVSAVDPGLPQAIAYRIARIHEASGHLVKLVHGEDWAQHAPPTVEGGESGFRIVPGALIDES